MRAAASDPRGSSARLDTRFPIRVSRFVRADDPKGSSVRRAGRLLLWAGAVALAIGMVGVVIPGSLGDRLVQAGMAKTREAAEQAAGEGQAGSETSDKAETRTRLAILRTGPNGRIPPVVALGRPVGSKNQADYLGTRQGILDRELVRQALLIAARDELGLSTRDELLDDAPPGNGEGETIEIATVFRANACRALVRQGEGPVAKVLQKYDLGKNPDDAYYLVMLTSLAEAMSRTEFTELLKQLGLKGKPNPVRERAPVPPEVERRLEEMGIIETFAAVRDLHEAMHDDGESPERLAALARAYAQLGVLTEYQWSSAHRAFKARALLYAERLVARSPKSAHALRGRAFVLALVGHHSMALYDLDEARKIDAGTKDPARPPSWLPVIQAYLKSDRKGLEISDGPDAKLAALLRMLLVEHPQGTRALVEAAREVVRRDPNCCRAVDVICEHGQLGDLHTATVVGPEAFTKDFPVKLKSLKWLPTVVRRPLDQNRDELTLVGALAQAGRPGVDTIEPSWAVLAHLVREVRFVHAWRRLVFMAYKWSVPVGEYWAGVQPYVAQHRYYPYLQTIVLPPNDGRAALAAFADRYDPSDVEPTERLMIDTLRRFGLPAGQTALSLCFNHGDILARDLAERITQTSDRKAHYSRVLLKVSPYSAYAMATLVENDWESVQGELAGWQEKVGNAPALVRALGKKYADLKQYDQAEKYLRLSLEQSPDHWVYQWLASSYAARGDRERWQATLDEFLAKTEPAGLEHAQVQVQIAEFLMSQKRWESAKPYAEAAGGTGAAWAMMCASECNEGLHNWERAELWIRRTAERYPGTTWFQWYVFCKRTGHGEVEAARAFADEYLASVEGRPGLNPPVRNGLFYWSIGSPNKAAVNLERAYNANPSLLFGFSLMLVNDELGNHDRRDQLLDDLCTKFQVNWPRVVEIFRMLRESLADGGKRPLDLQAVDRVLESMPAQARGNSSFLVGRFLLNRGRTADARKYLQQCADTPGSQLWFKAMAADLARSAGKAP
jgi:tetratricopeptide (TPR) repeat protein